MKPALCEILKIDFPIIMAPMFLVSNVDMMVSAGNAGIAGCIPALNFRTLPELDRALKEIKSRTSGPLGVNIIVNKSNVLAQKQLHTCLDNGVDFFITSLGSPQEVIQESKKQGIKVFCDVIEKDYARKVEDLGADAIIAVNSGAGGHLGNIPASVLIPLLKKNCSIPIISAGGVGSGAGVLSMLALGADGLSIGSPFIACTEAAITHEYKEACVQYGAQDIAVTTKLSGSRCTVINSPYLQKIGVEQNPIEKLLNQNKQLKKYAKMLTYYRGMKLLEKAAFSANYKSIWCAGSSIEFTDSIRPVSEIISQMRHEFQEAKINLSKTMASL